MAAEIVKMHRDCCCVFVYFLFWWRDRVVMLQSCDEDTGYIFPCFGDPDEEVPAASGMAPGAKLAFFDMCDVCECFIL